MAPSPRPLCDSTWWSFAGSTTLGSHSLCILSARQGAPPCFSRQVHGRAEESFSEKTVSLSRQPAATCARTCLPFSSSFAIPPRLGRVRQTAFRGSAARPSLPGPLHTSRCDFQPPDCCLRQWPSHFPLERLRARQQAEAHDSDRRRVPAPFSSPCTSARLRPYPLLGFLANRRRKALLPVCQRLLRMPTPSCPNAALPKASSAALWQCPRCGGSMLLVQSFTFVELNAQLPERRIRFDSS